MERKPKTDLVNCLFTLVEQEAGSSTASQDLSTDEGDAWASEAGQHTPTTPSTSQQGSELAGSSEISAEDLWAIPEDTAARLQHVEGAGDQRRPPSSSEAEVWPVVSSTELEEKHKEVLERRMAALSTAPRPCVQLVRVDDVDIDQRVRLALSPSACSLLVSLLHQPYVQLVREDDVDVDQGRVRPSPSARADACVAAAPSCPCRPTPVALLASTVRLLDSDSEATMSMAC